MKPFVYPESIVSPLFDDVSEPYIDETDIPSDSFFSACVFATVSRIQKKMVVKFLNVGNDRERMST